MLQSVAATTYSVSEFDQSCDAMRTVFHYRCVADGRIGATLATFWDSAEVIGKRYAVFAPASEEAVFVRLIESPVTSGYEPLKTYGWNAAEFHVSDVHALAESLDDTALRIIGGPRDLLENGSAVALQALGPSNELYYLTEISGERMQQTYGKAMSRVARVFIVVLGASNHEISRQYYSALTQGAPRARKFPIRVLAAAHGLDPMTTRFPIGSAVLPNQFRIEIDGYPASARVRPTLEGHLPPGLSMISFNTKSSAEHTFKPVRRATGPDEAPYFGHSIQLLYGPDGEWLELIESGL